MAGETMLSIGLGVIVGVVATVTMDVLGIVARKIGLTVGVDGRWIGRWYLGLFRGTFLHNDIAAVPERPGEMRAALIGHYAIGVVLAVAYVLGCGGLGLSPGSILVALVFGLATCVFPWFLMFPALGFGLLGLRGPSELRLLSTSVLNHLFYGFGLWWIAMLLVPA
jgi:hypothetical protein